MNFSDIICNKRDNNQTVLTVLNIYLFVLGNGDNERKRRYLAKYR